MKRITAAKHIKTHLREYLRRLDVGRLAQLDTYISRTGEPCPLCRACGGSDVSDPDCNRCLDWVVLPVPVDSRDYYSCNNFMWWVNNGPFTSLLSLIAALETELDRWAAEEDS